jgi:DNA polymerase-1
MVRVCEELGEPVPRTEKGGVSLDADNIEIHPEVCACPWCNDERAKLPEDERLDFPSPLEALASYGSGKAKIKRTQQLRKGVETPIQASFKSLIDSGRTACTMGRTKPGEPIHAWGSQLQNPQRAVGYRECFIPRPGFVLVSVDYEGLELRTWAQVCLWTVRRSRLAQALNEGRDPHVELGAALAGISLEEAYACHKKERGPEKAKWFKTFRQTSKPGNFGLPTGMGPAKIVLSARKSYGVNLGRAYDDPDKDKPAHPDVALAAAKQLKTAWKTAWPEADDYLKYIDRLLGGRDTTTIKQFVSKRARGGVWYTAAANGFFQGLAADLAKDAMWRVSREMYTDKSSPLYGSYLTNFVHDELIGELREDCAHEAAHRISQIMCETAQEWCPDLTFNAPPALMRRWLKDAEPTYDGNGRLIPWEPKAA